MLNLTRALVLAAVAGSALFLTSESASAQQLQGTWRIGQGDETWNLQFIGFDLFGREHYSFSYQGSFISGGGKLTLNPNNNNYIEAETTYIARDFLGHAIPVGDTATGYLIGPRAFILSTFRLDLVDRTLTFY